jgi:hypothetical protein
MARIYRAKNAAAFLQRYARDRRKPPERRFYPPAMKGSRGAD